MKKKDYLKPTMLIVQLKHQPMLQVASPVPVRRAGTEDYLWSEEEIVE